MAHQVGTYTPVIQQTWLVRSLPSKVTPVMRELQGGSRHGFSLWVMRSISISTRVVLCNVVSIYSGVDFVEWGVRCSVFTAAKYVSDIHMRRVETKFLPRWTI